MKIGMLISLLVLILIAAATFFALQGSPDEPTSATAGPGKLEKIILDTSELPKMWEPTDKNANATNLYNEAIDFYLDHSVAFADDDPPADLCAELCETLVKAAEYGYVDKGFLDKRVTLEPGGSREIRDAVATLASKAAAHGGRLTDKKTGLEVCRAVWSFGERVALNNEHIDLRLAGESAIRAAGNEMVRTNILDDNVPEEHAIWNDVEKWANVMDKLERARKEKLEIVKSGDPSRHIGDLLYIAQYDKDPGFRVLAIQKLGIAQFHPNTAANDKAIKQLFVDLKQSSNKSVAKAAEFAEKVDADEFHKIRW